MHQDLPQPEFYGDLVHVYEFKKKKKKKKKEKKKNAGRTDFSDQFRKIIICKCIGYNINIMRESAWLVFNSLIARWWVERQTEWWHRYKVIYFSWLGPEIFCLLLGPSGFICWFSFAPVFQWCCSTPQGSPGVGRNTLFLSTPLLVSSWYLSVIYLFPVMIHWWITKLHADRIIVCFEPWHKPRARLGSRKTGLSPPPPRPSILMPTVPSRYFCCSGCGIWLYQFLIIAYLFTFHELLGINFTSSARKISFCLFVT